VKAGVQREGENAREKAGIKKECENTERRQEYMGR
jgi:hypothetical protein